MLKKLLPLFFAAIAALPSFAADVPSQALFQTTSATITTQNLVPAGDCTTGGCAQSLMYAKGAASVQVTGTYTAAGGLSAQITNDGTTWITLGGSSTFRRLSNDATSATITSAQQDIYQLSSQCTSALACRITALGAVTGSARVIWFTSAASGGGSTTISAGAGDATAANQAAGNASLASIDNKTPALGTQAIASSQSVTPATSSTWAATQSGTWSVRTQDGAGNALTSAARGSERAMSVQIVDAAGTQITTFGGNIAGSTAHDAVGTSTNPVLIGGYASAAAPTDVSADGDAVREWRLRNGAGAVVQTFAGNLAAAGSGATTAGTQRVVHATDDPLIAAVNASNAQLPTALGATTASASLSIAPATDSTFTPTAQGRSAAVALTRTADTNAYAANDVIGAATGSTAALTFTSMCSPSGSNTMLTTVTLEIDASAVISGETSYRLYLYNVTPPSALGDNAAHDLGSGDRASFLGYVDLGTPVDLGSTLYVQTTGVNKQVKCSGTSLFGYLVTVGAYTPTSARVHVITLNGVTM
jgi:hypothetical protein